MYPVQHKRIVHCEQMNECRAIQKIRETINFQQTYADELYRSMYWQDYDLWFIEWMKHALQIIHDNPIAPIIVYKSIPTDHVIIQKVIQKKYIYLDPNSPKWMSQLQNNISQSW